MTEVTLQPMTAEEYAAFLDRSVRGYADEHMAAGNWAPDEAIAKSRAELAQLMPAAQDTEGMLFLTGRDGEGVPIGILWLSLTHPRGAPDTAFVYDLEVVADRRGQGLGRALLAAGEDELRRRGIGGLGLNVFGENTAAIALYSSSGYHVTTQQMRKDL